MGGSLKEIKAVKPEAAENPEIISLSEDLDIADQLAGFANSAAGKSTIKKLSASVLNNLNELFETNRKPELYTLISCIARLEQSLAMLRRFSGAKSDAEALLDLLKDKVSGK